MDPMRWYPSCNRSRNPDKIQVAKEIQEIDSGHHQLLRLLRRITPLHWNL